jgi:hypothetical protein
MPFSYKSALILRSFTGGLRGISIVGYEGSEKGERFKGEFAMSKKFTSFVNSCL